MAATLKLTAATTAELDLSTYLNVQEDGGLDPADGGFLEPAFSDSSIGAGQALVNIDAQNKELVYPVQLKAATKDALHALVQTIRRKLDEPGVRVEWRDDSATLSTFYDLEFGRLEPAYRYFRARQKWLTGQLHLWVRPYGHTATERLVATAAATGGPGIVLVGSLGGDVRALAQYTINVASYGETGDYEAVIAAVLPSPSYPFRTPAASMPLTAGGGASRIAGSGAAGSQFLGKVGVATGLHSLTTIVIPFPGQMAGRHRVLATVRSGQTATMTMYATNNQVIIGSIMSNATQWTLMDFGVWSVPSHIATAAGAALAFNVVQTASSALIGSYRYSLGEVYLIPEQQSCILKHTDDALQRYVLDGIQGVVMTATSFKDDTASLRGQIPAIPPAATVAIGILHAPVVNQQSVTGAAVVPPWQSLAVEVRVRERFSFQR